VTKPFSPRELTARVKVALRRQVQKEDTKKIEIGGILVIDLEKFAVKVDGEKIDLTSTEFKILQLLSSKQGWVFSRDKILDYLWGREKAVLDRTVDVHVKNLREKLGAAGPFIKNMRGIGYKLEV
jgi:two-component system phosphate regulon response regulator PhoB/two-component system alkaline phosphatase synthesis response regulator PhoP